MSTNPASHSAFSCVNEEFKAKKPKNHDEKLLLHPSELRTAIMIMPGRSDQRSSYFNSKVTPVIQRNNHNPDLSSDDEPTSQEKPYLEESIGNQTSQQFVQPYSIPNAKLKKPIPIHPNSDAKKQSEESATQFKPSVTEVDFYQQRSSKPFEANSQTRSAYKDPADSGAQYNELSTTTKVDRNFRSSLNATQNTKKVPSQLHSSINRGYYHQAPTEKFDPEVLLGKLLDTSDENEISRLYKDQQVTNKMLLEKLQILLKSQDEDKINIILSITSQDWIDSAVLQISLETTQNGQIELLTFFINCLKKCTRTISLDTFNKFIKLKNIYPKEFQQILEDAKIICPDYGKSGEPKIIASQALDAKVSTSHIHSKPKKAYPIHQQRKAKRQTEEFTSQMKTRTADIDFGYSAAHTEAHLEVLLRELLYENNKDEISRLYASECFTNQMLWNEFKFLLSCNDKNRINIIFSIVSQEWLDNAFFQISTDASQNLYTKTLPFFIHCLITFEKTISFDTFKRLIKLLPEHTPISKLLVDNSQSICPHYDLNQKMNQFNMASSHQQISIQSEPKAKPLSFLRLIETGQIDKAAQMVDSASPIDLQQALLYDQTYGNDKLLLKLLSTCYDQNVQIRAIKKLAQFGKVGIFKRIVENQSFDRSTLKDVFFESIKKQDLLTFDFFYRNLKTDSWISDFFHKSCYEPTLDNLAKLILILKDRNHNRIKLSNHHVIDHILDRASHYPEDTQLIKFILEYFEF